jgi:adenylate cyclase
MPLRSPPRFALPTRRDLRWISGLVLLGYVSAHLLNHALGLVSLALAEAVLHAVHSFWHSLPGTLLLYGAATTHIVLALLSVWDRRSLRMQPLDALRLLLGFSLPLLLASHLSAMRWAYEAFALDASYARVVGALWSFAGAGGQFALMAAAWAHGCLGVHMALRAKAGYRRHSHGLLVAAVLLPVLAVAGFLSMGRELQWSGPMAVQGPTPAQGEAIEATERRIELFYGLLLLALFAARQLRTRRERRPGSASITLRYPERSVHVPRGWSVLDASRAHGIAHLSVCGGRARCSTCRVRVQGPPAHLEPPGRDERRTLDRVRAPADVRLACQLRPRGDIAVTPLFAPASTERSGHFGRERDVAILFVDLRRWSGLSENQWPFDLAYLLERYFATVGAAVRESGGVPNQFIGDSVMAIFGLEVDLPTAWRQAVRAAELIGERMDAWSSGFESQFGHRLDFGMGLHAGRTAVGEVGYLETTTFTAVGEVVNTASRLQDHSKVADARLVISLFAARQAGIAERLGATQAVQTVQLRGRSEALEVLHVPRPTPAS